MEILEKQDPEKRRLMDEAKKHKDNLKHEVHLVSEQTQKIITNALIIGGALTLTYLLISGFSNSKSRKKKNKAIKLVAHPQAESNHEATDENDGSDSILSQIG